MGEVYRAHDTRLGRDVAIKILAASGRTDPDALDRFKTEARSVAALSHPNILALHDIGEEDGTPFAVMELLEGQSLRERLEQGVLPWRKAAEIGIAVAEGLSAAHAKGIVHRDLKPENLFITLDGRLKILDFGLATVYRPFVAASTDDSVTPTIRTLQQLVVGTIGYMSPEQARGEDVDATSDLFSLGCVLYELTSGRRPFQRDTPSESLAAVLTLDPTDPAASDRSIPADFSRIVLHCLEKNPRERFQSARDLAFALSALLADSTVDDARRLRGTSGKSVAVLPFVNVAGDPEMEYLGDGIAEEIINTLASVPKLRVVPRSIAFRYKGRDLDPRAIGVELNARALLTGRVFERGGRLSIQVDLIDTIHESQLWGRQFVRSSADLFAVQEEIAREIGEALKVRFKGRAKKRPKAREARDSRAYQDYLRGRYHLHRWTPAGFGKAVEYFEAAVSKDPTFAPAHAGLGTAYGGMDYYGYLERAIALPRAEAASRRAVDLDDTLAEAHSTLALMRTFFHFDWKAAEQEFTRALELDEHYAFGRAFYALFLAAQGRRREAREHARRARNDDPVSPLITIMGGWVRQLNRDFVASDEEAVRVLELAPDASEGLLIRTASHEHRGKYRDAKEYLRAWLLAVGQPVDVIDQIYRSHPGDDATSYWHVRLATCELFEHLHMMNVYRAGALARVGQVDGALDLLETSVDQRAGSVVFLAVDPIVDPLHGHPRFQRILERLDLADVRLEATAAS